MNPPNHQAARDDIAEAAKKTADYLYTIKGDCPKDLYQAIGRLRQLINEEFVGKDKSVSSQLIYDIINPTLLALIEANNRQARIDELLGLNKIALKVARAKGTGYEELSTAYDNAVIKRLAELTKSGDSPL